jgi:prepilin-type N-terminal cleavage/methylation domain-containing protein
MKLAFNDNRQSGFTLLELLMALGMFLVVTGAAFTLLSTSQQRYQTESQVLTSFQEARLGLDQMVRDINDAGFPSRAFSNGQASSCAITPFAWSIGAGYSSACISPPAFTPCQILTGGGTCFTASGDTAPGDFDLIIETEPNPLDSACTPNCSVQWIRYQLVGTTLMRAVAPKVSGDDPDTDTSAQLVPFVQNVVNNTCPPQLPNCQAAIGGGPVAIFQYICDTPSVSQTVPPATASCPLAAAADNSPANIRDVMITLIVAAPLPDATTGKPRLVQLEGRGRRINPNQ